MKRILFMLTIVFLMAPAAQALKVTDYTHATSAEATDAFYMVASGQDRYITFADIENSLVLTPSQVGLGNVTNEAQMPLSYLDISSSLSNDSDARVPSQHAVKTYIDAGLAEKQASLVLGNISGGTGLSVSGGTSAVVGSGVVVSVASGYYLPLSSDKTLWDAAYSSRVTSAVGTSPLTLTLSGTSLSGSIAAAGASQSGYLTSTDWSTFNDKQPALGYTPVPNTRTVNGHALSSNVTVTKSDVGLGNVSNTAQVTAVTGSGAIQSTGGTTPAISIDNAVANGSTKGAATFTANDFNDNGSGLISIDYTNAQAATSSAKGFLTAADWTTFNSKQSSLGSLSGIVKGNGSGSYSAATAGSDYEVPVSAGTGLTRSTNTFSVNSSQVISRLSNLTSNGFIKAGSSNGTLSVDTTTYVPETLTVNGHALSSNVTLSAEDVLPTQTGNSGKILQTNGTTASWQTAAGNVSGPDTNTDEYVPLWNGTDTKILKNGLGVGTSANNLVQLDADAKLPGVDGSLLENVRPPEGWTALSSAWSVLTGISGIPISDGNGGFRMATSADFTNLGNLSGLVKGNGFGAYSAATPGTDYELPLTAADGLSRSGNTLSVLPAGSEGSLQANIGGKLAGFGGYTSSTDTMQVSNLIGSKSVASISGAVQSMKATYGEGVNKITIYEAYPQVDDSTASHVDADMTYCVRVDGSVTDMLTLKADSTGSGGASQVQLLQDTVLSAGKTLTVPTTANIKGMPHKWHIVVPAPNSLYNTITIVPLAVKVDAALTVDRITVTTSSGSYDVAGDLKYADDRGLGNAAVINDFDTTSGVRDDTTIGQAVSANKFLYLQWDSQPDANITDVTFDIYYHYT